MVRVSKIALHTPGASASAWTMAQLVPLQMSEPWHASKPARQAGCTSTGAQVQRAQCDRRGQRTVITSEAIPVLSRGPHAERRGLLNAAGSPIAVEHEKDDIRDDVQHRAGERPGGGVEATRSSRSTHGRRHPVRPFLQRAALPKTREVQSTQRRRKINNRTRSGLLAAPGEPLVGKPKFRTPLYRTVEYW